MDGRNVRLWCGRNLVFRQGAIDEISPLCYSENRRLGMEDSSSVLERQTEFETCLMHQVPVCEPMLISPSNTF